ELSEAGDGATIVAAIVALAKALNLQIVAEGVENETQQQFLTQLGCHTLQGFLLGKPRTAEEIARDIRDPANIFTRSIYNINSK
ncbi:TPA: EAL domain-containing protein, partial [Salmonella enterica subsp. enterica serovar Typhimurium]|nr:EAL domain-containing protein [Salmonella enterica subsp. enterica serovar Typhimurium]